MTDYEYKISVKPCRYVKGYCEGTWYCDVVFNNKDIAIGRSETYHADTKAEAKAKAETIARDHAAKLKAENAEPETYTFIVE